MQLQELFALQPIDNASALHAEFYNNERWLKVEQERVFSQSWQLAGHVGELNAPGDHVVCEIAGKPILIVRNAVNELRAFYNVCRHRAGPLALCRDRKSVV